MSMRTLLAALALALAILPVSAQTPPPAAPAAEPAPAITPETQTALTTLAAKTALPPGARILCLGDSITAVTPRQPVKYPEMLAQVLAAKYGDKVQVLNAGKGGDNVLSALKRAETDVLPKQPTLVFINLGVNDSKLVAPAHERNQIPLDQFTTGYRDLIKLIREKTGAAVVVVGTIACADELTRAIATGEKKRTYFGNPDQLKKYNAAARDIAAEFKCDYVDLFDLFMAQPDLKALFPGDGVHANQKGQELIALQLMKFLAHKFPAQSGK